MKTKKAPAARPATAPASHRPFEALAKAARKKPKPAPAAPPPPPAPAAPARDDAATFALAMAGVEALSPSRKTRIPRTLSRVERVARPAPPRRDEAAEAELAALVVSGLRFELTDDGERIEGRRVEVEPKVLRRLRHGRGVIDAKLDLHGKTSAEARRALEAFIQAKRTDGERLLLVVHGKGLHSEGGRGVLRGEIGAWLSQGPAARHVAAFATPPDELGGEGALLVLLAP